MDEAIFIPTRGRIGKQLTYNHFSKNILNNHKVKLVCTNDESKHHRKLGYKTLICPIEGIGSKRQWIMEYAKLKNIKYTMMCDDDITDFFIRKSNKAFNLRKTSIEELEKLIENIFILNKKYPFSGLSYRSGNNNFFPKKIVTCVRSWGIFSINTRLFFKNKIRFDRLQCMEDFDVILQFLEKGYENAIITNAAWDSVSNAPGGCSIYRNEKVQKEYAIKLKELHNGFVSISERKTKSSWKGMQKRIDVIIQWKKAFNSSMKG
uniref:TET-Associated Glycosyltransferase domain-containing protein n=1 Tax=viral metagenome TaxID=1070528 RepID=A0A6M3L4J5_9ZZZZ